MGDGNFKYNPKEFHNQGQLYTLRAIVSSEAHPVVYALMQSIVVRAYETLLKCVRDAMLRRFAGTGTLALTETWIFDYEVSAIIATKNVFGAAPGTIKVCPGLPP